MSKAEYTAFGERFGKLEFGNAPISNTKKDGSVVSEDEDPYVFSFYSDITCNSEVVNLVSLVTRTIALDAPIIGSAELG